VGKDLSDNFVSSHYIWPKRMFWRDDGDGIIEAEEYKEEYLQAYVPTFSGSTFTGGSLIGGPTEPPAQYKVLEYNSDGSPKMDANSVQLWHYALPRYIIPAGASFTLPSTGYRTGFVNAVRMKNSAGYETWIDFNLNAAFISLTLYDSAGNPSDYVAIGGDAIMAPSMSLWASENIAIPKRTKGSLVRIRSGGNPLDTNTPIDWRYDFGTLGFHNDSEGFNDQQIWLY
jgi:hypothetical protein